MNRDTVVAFTPAHANAMDNGPSLPPLGEGRTDDLHPPPRKAVDQKAPAQKRTSKKIWLVALIVGGFTVLGYQMYAGQLENLLTHLWPSKTSSAAEKAEALTLLGQRVTRLEAAHTVSASRDTAMQNDLAAVQRTLQNVATPEHVSVLEAQLASGHASLDTRVSKLERDQRQRIKPITRQSPAAPVAAPPTLPFRVVSIDLWNDRPYVAVAAQGLTELLAVGDHRAGWEVRDINRSNGQATFVNTDGTTIKRSAQDGSL